MRLTCIILGLINAILAVILSVLPLSNFAFFPAIAALIFGILAFIKIRQEKKTQHTVQLIFLLAIISLGLATYKSITVTTEVGDTKQLERRDQDSKEEAIEELNDIDFEDAE